MEGIIYGIKEISSEEIIYIGSTINLYNRKKSHKCNCFTRQLNLLVYNYIREKTDKEHFDEHFVFEVIFSGEFETKQELRIKENEFIKEKTPKCNNYKAFRTKEDLKKWHREYAKNYKYWLTEKWRDYQRKWHSNYRKTSQRRDYMHEYYLHKKLAK